MMQILRKSIVTCLRIFIIFTLPLFFILGINRNIVRADKFEPDNTWQDACPILVMVYPTPQFIDLSYEWIQTHDFYETGDKDWIKFYAYKDEYYTVSVKDPGEKCDVVIEIFEADGETLITSSDYTRLGEEEDAGFLCTADGIYYARTSQCDTNTDGCYAGYGEQTQYKLSVVGLIGIEGNIQGKICPSGLRNITVSTDYAKTLADINGNFSMTHPEGKFTLSASGEQCYGKYTQAIQVIENESMAVYMNLDPVYICTDNNNRTTSCMNGSVTDENGIPLCSMALANGQYMFSCIKTLVGEYLLEVPLDENGEIVLHTFVDGFKPFKEEKMKPVDGVDFDIKMLRAGIGDPGMTITYEFSPSEKNPIGWTKISGQVLSDVDKTPLCAMVLINGQHMFSCDPDGEYELDVPLNEKGEISLLVFCDGFKPFSETSKPSNSGRISYNKRMLRSGF